MTDTTGAPQDSGSVPSPGQFDSVGEWFAYLRSEGFSIPVQAPHALSRVMDTFDMDHQEAFTWLVERRLLIVMPAVVIVDLRAMQVDLRTVGEAVYRSPPDSTT